MSRKSTAGISSAGEGDVEAKTYREGCSNVLSDSSSHQSKRELTGGPYGDSPPDQKNCTQKDFYILMYRNNDESTDDTSESVDQDDVYMQKLNWIRQRLNLVEIGDGQRSGCKITEIIDEEEVVEENVQVPTATQPNEDEVKTKSLFSIRNVDEIRDEILDLEYNPPKKMSCHRIRTPKLVENSEAKTPYHIRVSLNENLFKADNSGKIPQEKWKQALAKFTETKEVQCDGKELLNNTEQVVKSKVAINKAASESSVRNLFPEVIVKTKHSTNKKSLPKTSFSSPTNVITREYTRVVHSDCVGTSYGDSSPATNFLINCVENFGEGASAFKSSVTTINLSPKKKKGKRRRGRKRSIWEDVGRLEGGGDDSRWKRKSGETTHYVSYRRERNRAKSSPIKSNKQPVLYGPDIVNNSDVNNLDRNFYLCSSSSEPQSSCMKSTDGQSDPLWKRLFCCFGSCNR